MSIPGNRRRRLLRALLTLVVLPTAVLAPSGAARAADDSSAAPTKIVISGASGQLAGDTIAALLSRGIKPDQLILVTRTPEKLSSFAANGAEVRAGDFTKPDTLDRAFAGGRALLLISTNGGDRVAQHSAAISAARKAGIRHIVYTSFINPTPDNPSAVARDHRLTEEALDRSGVPYTVLRNQLYMDGLVEEARVAIVTGDLYTNAGRGKWAPVTRRDCAEVAAVVLTTPGHTGKSYDITGPDLINRQDFAKLITEVTGKRVRVIDVDDSTIIQRAVQEGQPEAAAKVMASFGTAMRMNTLNIKAEVAQILMGRKPESLRELLTRNKTKLVATTTR